MRASLGRLAGRPCSTRTGIMWPEGEAGRRSPHVMPAYDPNVCRRRLPAIPQLPRGSWQEGKLKGLIAGCGGQAFELCPRLARRIRTVVWQSGRGGLVQSGIVWVPGVACAMCLGWAAITG
jgi:hypothetical protein